MEVLIMDSDDDYVPLKKRLISKGLIIDLTEDYHNNKVIEYIDDDDNDRVLKQQQPQQASSFATLRRNKCNDLDWVLFRPRRAANLTIIRDWLNSKRTYKVITQNVVKTFITSCLEKFQIPEKLRSIIIKQSQKQVLIDQDIYDACSYVAYCHLKFLNDLGLEKNWLKNWKKISPEGKPFEDIGSMLDVLSTITEIDPSLQYIPFRTSDENENRFNTILPETNGLTFASPYERIRHCFESLLDKGIPIAFNQAQHSRVAIAYNNEDILCIDSFSRLYEESHEYMYFVGGLSTVKKDFVYQWVRDAVILR